VEQGQGYQELLLNSFYLFALEKSPNIFTVFTIGPKGLETHYLQQLTLKHSKS